MGNSKSRKVNISQEEPSKSTEGRKERINVIKSEVDGPADSDPKDNASSASTVEVLDDK